MLAGEAHVLCDVPPVPQVVSMLTNIQNQHGRGDIRPNQII